MAEGEKISRTDAETLLFAREKEAEVLVDEKALSNLARMFRLKAWNTWTVLLESLRMNFIGISDIEDATKELGEKRHKMKKEQAAQILEAARLIARKREEKGVRYSKSIRKRSERGR